MTTEALTRKDRDSGSVGENKYERVFIALLTTDSHQDAIAQAGISRATLTRYLNEPKFIEMYRLARNSLVDEAISNLQKLSLAAVRALEESLTCHHAPTKVRAAKIILELAMRGSALVSFDKRLEAIEDKVEQKLLAVNWDQES